MRHSTTLEEIFQENERYVSRIEAMNTDFERLNEDVQKLVRLGKFDEARTDLSKNKGSFSGRRNPVHKPLVPQRTRDIEDNLWRNNGRVIDDKVAVLESVQTAEDIVIYEPDGRIVESYDVLYGRDILVRPLGPNVSEADSIENAVKEVQAKGLFIPSIQVMTRLDYKSGVVYATGTVIEFLEGSTVTGKVNLYGYTPDGEASQDVQKKGITTDVRKKVRLNSVYSPKKYVTEFSDVLFVRGSHHYETTIKTDSQAAVALFGIRPETQSVKNKIRFVTNNYDSIGVLSINGGVHNVNISKVPLLDTSYARRVIGVTADKDMFTNGIIEDFENIEKRYGF